MLASPEREATSPWPVRVEMGCGCRMHTGFQRRSMLTKDVNHLVSNFLCGLHIDMIIFWIYWVT